MGGRQVSRLPRGELVVWPALSQVPGRGEAGLDIEASEATGSCGECALSCDGYVYAGYNDRTRTKFAEHYFF